MKSKRLLIFTTFTLSETVVKVFLISLCAFVAPGTYTVCAGASAPKDFTQYVNPLMGTMSEIELSAGNTYPAIARPWGMNFWVPQTGVMGNGWTYVYSAHRIRGFKQTHQPSPWINDYGVFSIMPVVGMKINEQDRASWFSHNAEKATPYYYSVYLADHDIVAEITPTERAASFRFTYPESEESAIVIDAFDHGSFIKLVEGQNKIIGYTTRNNGGVPANFKNYFVIEFDKTTTVSSIWTEQGELCDCDERADNHVGTIIRFKTKRGEKVNVKAASSFISIEQAERNLLEVADKSFDQVVAEGKDAWNEVLGVFDIEAGLDQMRTFYSCLYRSVLFPRMFYEMDAEGKPIHYSPYNGEILPGYMYTDTGFWDTFRSLFPLLNLAYPSVNAKIQEGLLNTYKESGFLPEWASPGHRHCMVGNNSASVISDAILKGVTPRALQLPLYEAMIATANSVNKDVPSTGRLGFEFYNTLGYVPYDVDINESAARTLEYAYNDWCIAQVAKKMNRPEQETQLYTARAHNYANLLDSSVNLMRGKNKDGKFQTPFNPLKWGDAFTEGNSWHYTWSVFHDVEGLSQLMGGCKQFVTMLDSLFSVPPHFDESYYGEVIHEIREMQIVNMGNYAHGNQPAQHIVYLYNYAGQPWKTQFWARETMDKLYHPTPDGYCGDEDNGQTSAWYVFSSLGFYPVCPGTDQYAIGSPLVSKATIHLQNGNKIKITAPENSEQNRYIRRISLNGKNLERNYMTYSELTKGVAIQFTMDDMPDMKRGTSAQALPYSMTDPR